jgi:nicotinamidase-related amidase
MTDPRFSLLTPRETVVALIDYQQQRFGSVRAPERQTVLSNAIVLAKAADLFEAPVILTTLTAEGLSGDVLPEIQAIFPDEKPICRTTRNPWEDSNFRFSVTNFGRQKIIMAGLWIEACVYLPALDAIAEGYDVYVPIDACGDAAVETHERAVKRAIQAGVIPMTALQVIFEWQRDSARQETYEGCMEILKTHSANVIAAGYAKTSHGD